MKTSVIEVRDMLSVLSVSGVEERIGKVGGVESATVNFAAGTATVRYDETRLNIADIRSDVRQSGYETESAPGTSPGKGHEGHEGHNAAGAQPAAAPKDKAAPDVAPASPPKPAQPTSADTPTPAAPKSAPADSATVSAGAAPPSGGQPDKAAPDKS